MYEFRPRLSFFMEIFKFICMPICLLTAAAFIGSMPQQRNALTVKEGQELSGVKKGAFSEDFSIKDLKAAAKRNNSSVNDYMMSIVGVALNKYYIKQGETPR